MWTFTGDNLLLWFLLSLPNSKFFFKYGWNILCYLRSNRLFLLYFENYTIHKLFHEMHYRDKRCFFWILSWFRNLGWTRLSRENRKKAIFYCGFQKKKEQNNVPLKMIGQAAKFLQNSEFVDFIKNIHQCAWWI